MRMRICLSLAAMAAAASHAAAANVPSLTLQAITEEAQTIAVGEVTDLKTLGKTDYYADKFPAIPFITRRATVKVFRGIEAAGNKPLKLKTLAIDYIDYDPSVQGFGSGMPMLPGRQPGVYLSLAVGTHAIFPLKLADAAADPPVFRLLREEGTGLIAPGFDDPLDENPATSLHDFMMRELASPFVHGNVHDFFAVDGYLRNGRAVDAATQGALLKSLVPLIKDRNQWIDIAVAGCCRAASDNVTLKLNMHDLVAGSLKDPGLAVPLFAIQQAGGNDPEDDLLRALAAHQDELGPAACARIIDVSYMDNPHLIELERTALAEGDAGAIAFCGTLLKDHPDFALRAPALNAARKLLANAGVHHAAMSDAVPLLLSFGTDDDAAAIAAQLEAAEKTDASLAQTMLEAAEGAANVPLDRAKSLLRVAIDCTQPLPKPPYGPDSAGWRICDTAGVYAESVLRENFSLRPTDPVATRDQALNQIRERLKKQPWQ